MTMIEIPDEQAAALNARAAAMGLSLKGWLETLAEETPAVAEQAPFKIGRGSLSGPDPSSDDIAKSRRDMMHPQAAVDRIFELRKGNRLPDGVSIQDLIHAGRA